MGNKKFPQNSGSLTFYTLSSCKCIKVRKANLLTLRKISNRSTEWTEGHTDRGTEKGETIGSLQGSWQYC